VSKKFPLSNATQQWQMQAAHHRNKNARDRYMDGPLSILRSRQVVKNTKLQTNQPIFIHLLLENFTKICRATSIFI